MTTFQDTFTDASNLSSTLGSEVVSGELRPIDHDDGVTLSFNGSTQYGTATSYKGVTGTSACSILGWFKSTSTGTNNTIIRWGSNSSGPTRRWILLEDGVIWDRLAGNTINGGNSLNDGRWHHFALTKPSGGTTALFKLYVDGVVAPITPTGATTVSPVGIDDVTVGSVAGGSLFDGSLDDIRLYNTELTADQIFALVRGGIEPPTTNLQAQWLFNNGSGSSVTDNSGNGRTLTLTGSPTWVTTHKPFYGTRSQSTSTELVTGVSSIEDFDFTLSKKSAGTIGRFQFSEDGSTWVNAAGDSLTGYGAYDFDGVNDFGVATGYKGVTGTSARTYMAWFRTTGGNYLISYGLNTAANRYTFSIEDGVFWFRGAVGNTLEYDGGYNDGRWHHIAVTNPSSATTSTMVVYIDGVPIPATVGGSDVLNIDGTTTDVHIGAYGIGSVSAYFQGTISDVRLYSEELSAGDIASYFTDAIEPSTANLEAHWKLNTNSTSEIDSSGNGRTLSMSGATYSNNWCDLPAIGNIQTTNHSVLSFDGVNDLVTISDNNVFSFGNSATDSPFSVSGWFYLADFSITRLVGKYVSGGAVEWLLFTDGSDQLYLRLYDNDTSNFINVLTNSLPANLLYNWMHIAATYDGSSSSAGIKIYLNGNQINTSSSSSGSYSAMHNTTAPLRFMGDTSVFTNGKACNVAIWSDVRTQAEIIQEVENGFADTGNANLIAYYPLDGNADDYLGNYDGSIDGAVTTTDYYRPAPTEPTQSTIDVSGLGYTDFYYRYVTDSHDAQLITTLTEVSVDSAAEIVIECTGIESEETIGDHSLALTLQPSAISSEEVFGTLSSLQNLVMIAIASEEVIGDSNIAVIFQVDGISSEEVFGTFTQKLSLAITGVASTEAIGDHSFATTIRPNSIASSESFGTFEQQLNLVATGINSAESFGDSSFAIGYFIQMDAIESDESIGSPVFYGYILSRLVPGQTDLKKRNVSSLKGAAIVPAITIKNQNLPIQQFPTYGNTPGFKVINEN